MLLSGKKILYVDDDDFLANLISKKIESEGASVMHAANADITYEKMDSNKFDLIILDMLLPNMKGLDLLESLQKKYDLNGISIVVFSNLSVAEDMERAKTLGADKYLIKAHVVPEEISGILAGILEEHGKVEGE